MSWSDKYVGLPFEDLGRSRSGCDCWGLACLVYADELSIRLPSYLDGYASADERREVSDLIAGQVPARGWRPVAQPEPFDLLLFRIGHLDSHVGISVRPGLMLHMARDDQSKLERMDFGRWQSRFAGAFRHGARP